MSNGGLLHINGNCISPALSTSPPLSVPAPPPPPSLSSSSKLLPSSASVALQTHASSTNLTGTGNATATASTFRQTTNAHMNNINNNINRGTSFIRCRCGTIGQITADGHLHATPTTTNNTMGRSTINYGHPTNNIYTGYDGRGGRLIDEEDSACPALLEREFHSLHRNVPGLRRAGVDTNAIRQHFYPDGGWGWIICGVAFLAHVLTTGFQLSFGLLLIYAIPHLGQERAIETGWLGSTSWAISMFTAPIVIALCRRKSTRLTAVIGGLILALGILFTSFATQFHQVAVSYGIIVGVGAAMVRESSAVMLGHYFKRRRQFVEMITMAGEGVGIALFSVIFKEIVGNKNLGWRLGLQFVTGLISFCFFMGLFYRPASLYHPQRRAILHLKNQRKKVKEKKTHIRTPKPPFMDFTPFKSSTVRMFIVISFLGSIGVYGPIFFMSLHGYHEGYDVQDLVLLQTFLGLSLAFGIVISGLTMNKIFTLGYKKFNITTQFVCQISIVIASIAILILSGVTYYRSMCFVAWGYGLGLGGYRYSLKMFALERIRAKHFTKAWGFIRGAESISILFGVPFVAFLNDASVRYGRAGYYVGSAVTAISAVLMFFVGYPTDICGGNCNNSNGCGNCGTCANGTAVCITGGTNCNNGHLISCAAGRQNLSKYSTNGSITSHCTMPTQTTTTSTNDCPDLLNRSFSGRGYGCGGGLTKWCNSNNNNNNSTSHNSINNCTNNNHHNHHQHLYHNQVGGHHTNLHRRHHSHQYPYGPLNLTNNNNNNNQYLNNYYLQNHCHNDLITNNNTINNGRLHKSLSLAFQTPIMWNDCYLQPQHQHQHHHHQQQQQQHQYQPHHRMSYSHVPYTNNRCWTRCDIHPQYISSTNGLQQNPTRSRSVPEGLATNTSSLHGVNCECSTSWNYRNRWQSCSFRQPSSSSSAGAAIISKPIQVVEQITTSV